MENQTNHHHNSKATKPSKTISLTMAKIWVTRWLKTIAAMPGFEEDKNLIPRAIYISIEDIKELFEKYPEKDLVGIRMYFGIAGEAEPEPVSVENLRGLIVPVFSAEPYRPHADLIQINDPANPNDTSIYDFTAPCPAYCDKKSELYVPIS